MAKSRVQPPRINTRRRKGRCYELAGRGQQLDPTWTLIHGYIAMLRNRNQSLLIAHAWLQKRGRVYDPVDDIVLRASEYTQQYGAEVVRRYPFARASRFVRKSEHWGPWHDDIPILIRGPVTDANATQFQSSL